jgi:arylsulfatase A-like enzyme
VLTADHGEAFYEHGAWEHGRAAAVDKPGLYDEIVHIPLIVKWPGETRGASIPDVVSQMDVAATILEAAGIESTSAWSLGLRRHVDADGPREPRQAIAEVATFDPTRGAGLQIAFRDRELKYIASFRARTVRELYRIRPTREELYDLVRDPRERSNLIERPNVDLGSFRAALRTYVAAARELAPADDGEIVLDEALMEELRALGYIDP